MKKRMETIAAMRIFIFMKYFMQTVGLARRGK
jgi:hypothetical protein